MTPKAVLDAGNKERERYRHGCDDYRLIGAVMCDGQPTGFVGTHDGCQDFIDDRVFRAMLLEYADELPPTIVDMYYHGTLQKSRPALSTIIRALAEGFPWVVKSSSLKMMEGQMAKPKIVTVHGERFRICRLWSGRLMLTLGWNAICVLRPRQRQAAARRAEPGNRRGGVRDG